MSLKRIMAKSINSIHITQHGRRKYGIVDKIGKIGQRILWWQWMGMRTDSKSGQFQHFQ